MRDLVRRRIGAILIAVVLTIPAVADACRCVPRAPAALARAADAVVLAGVIAIDDRNPDARIYTLQPVRSWKTRIAGRILVRSAATSCRAELTVGTRYLVYLKSTGTGYRTDACSGNLPAARATSVIAGLGRPRG